MTGTTGLVVVMLFALLAGGLVCIGTALKWEWRTARRARKGCVAAAEVVDLVAVGGSPDDPAFLTVLEFRDGRGVPYRIQSRWAQSPAPYKVGQAVRVSYEADDPRGADIVNRSLGVVLGVLGLTFTLVAAILLQDVLRYGVTAQSPGRGGAERARKGMVGAVGLEPTTSTV